MEYTITQLSLYFPEFSLKIIYEVSMLIRMTPLIDFEFADRDKILLNNRTKISSDAIFCFLDEVERPVIRGNEIDKEISDKKKEMGVILGDIEILNDRYEKLGEDRRILAEEQVALDK